MGIKPNFITANAPQTPRRQKHFSRTTRSSCREGEHASLIVSSLTNRTGSGSYVDVEEEVHATALRLQRRALRLCSSIVKGRGQRECRVSRGRRKPSRSTATRKDRIVSRCVTTYQSSQWMDGWDGSELITENQTCVLNIFTF